MELHEQPNEGGNEKLSNCGLTLKEVSVLKEVPQVTKAMEFKCIGCSMRGSCSAVNY